MEKNKPIYTRRKGLVSASLFERVVKGVNGSFKSRSIALNISYKKGDNFEQNSITIIKQNLDSVIEVLKEVQAKML